METIQASDSPEDTGDAEIVELTLPAEPASVTAARRAVTQHWTDLDEDTLADVELIVTELVANAIRHGEPEIIVRLRKAPFAIDVAVLDHGPGTPEIKPPSTDRTSGRGLAIVDQLSLTWGFEPLTGRTGKIVWASVDRT